MITSGIPVPSQTSYYVRCIVLVHFQGSQVTSDVKKSVRDKSLVTRDRARTHTSELSQGSLGTKIVQKTTLYMHTSRLVGAYA